MIVITCDYARNVGDTPYEIRVTTPEEGRRRIALIEEHRTCPGHHALDEFDETADRDRARRASKR